MSIPVENSNFIYFYHTQEVFEMPIYPENISDSRSVTFSTTNPLGRSAPIYSFSYGGPREINLTLKLHREIGQDENGNQLWDVETLISRIQAAALPVYDGESIIDPPLVYVSFGEDIQCKGVINSAVTITYSGPILEGNVYGLVDIAFNICEVDPVSADTMQRNVWAGG